MTDKRIILAEIAAFVARTSMIASLIFVSGFLFDLLGLKRLAFPFALLPGFLGGALGFYLSSLIEIRPAAEKKTDG